MERYSGFGYKTHGDGWKIIPGEKGKNGSLRLSGIGVVKIRGRAKHVGVPKTLEISRKGSAWYASVTIDCSLARESGKEAVGIDWGLETFATVAKHYQSVSCIENPRILRKRLREPKTKAERSLS